MYYRIYIMYVESGGHTQGCILRWFLMFSSLTPVAYSLHAFSLGVCDAHICSFDQSLSSISSFSMYTKKYKVNDQK